MRHAVSHEHTSPREVVKRLYEQAINERRLELLPELVSAEYVGPRGERGPEGFADVIEGLVAGIPDIRFEIRLLIGDANAAAIRWEWSGHHTGTLFGIPASHRHVTNTGIAIYHLADGKITRSSVETDRLGLLQQVGLVPDNVGRSSNGR